jgi:hypothetical protein
LSTLTPEDRKTLERLGGLAVRGRLAEAELELHAWVGRGGPTAARVLLGALLARREDYDAARQVLGTPPRAADGGMDPEQAKLTVAVLVNAGLDDDARRLSAWLYHQHGHDPAVSRWIARMDVPGLTALPAVPDATIDRLAAELGARPDVIPSLVYAQKQAPRTRPISLLRAGLARMSRHYLDTPEEPQIYQALAELAVLIGDDDDARHWAHKGLRLDPFNATLALLLGGLEDDTELGPTAAETLKRVSLRFPGYPDVRRALEQRVERDQEQTRVA